VASPSAKGGAQAAAELGVLCWNLFHGRDAPPNPRPFTLRSRLLEVTEHDRSHLQVNRLLLNEFADLIASTSWSLCLLQEVPPWWAEPLASRSGAVAHRVLTSRNQLAPLRRWLATLNADLVGSAQGGSNLTLVRPPWRVSERRSLLLNPLPRRGLRERRRMGFLLASLEGNRICVGNLHATAGSRAQAELDVLTAAEAAVSWADGRPLLLGGDSNLRPATARLFVELERRFGLASPTAGPRSDAIDHLLVRGVDVVEAPARWPPERREVEASFDGGVRRLRLSDHAPVEALYRLRASSVR
jgi:endonuclease/exonuclease/phosphatase family metal-dependent hydrolase